MNLQTHVMTLGAVLLGLVLGGGAAAEDLPICIAQAALEPPSAVVGQQVSWQVTIEMRDDVKEVSWVNPPAFAHIRTERLPGQPARPAMTRNGHRVFTRIEQRALFAERVGALRLESEGLRCTLGNGLVIPVPVPAVVLDVTPLPPAGRGNEHAHIIGPLVLETHIDPKQVTLGEFVTVTVSIRGTGNLWDIADPLPRPRPNSPTAPEIFERPPELDLRPGVRLSVQRVFRYDFVPRTAGLLSIPALAITYYDPNEHTYRVAKSSAQVAEVRTAPAKRELGTVGRSDSVTTTRDDRSANGFYAAVALAVGAGAAGIFVWQRWRPSGGSKNAALAAAARAAADGDRDREATELMRALQSALAPHIDEPVAKAAQPFERADLDPAVAAALETLRDLERARFDPRKEPPDRAMVETTIRGLRNTRRREPFDQGKNGA